MKGGVKRKEKGGEGGQGRGGREEGIRRERGRKKGEEEREAGDDITSSVTPTYSSSQLRHRSFFNTNYNTYS